MPLRWISECSSISVSSSRSRECTSKKRLRTSWDWLFTVLSVAPGMREMTLLMSVKGSMPGW